MRHIVKETGLCETGILCFFQSDLQLVIELLCIISLQALRQLLLFLPFLKV